MDYNDKDCTYRKWKCLILLPLISFKLLEIVKLTKLKQFNNRVAPYYYLNLAFNMAQ